jgi:hypothetical protein
MTNLNINLLAKKGAEARWTPKATHQGEINILGRKLPCVVLEDGRRIISQKSIFDAFDRPRRGARNKDENGVTIPAFLDSKNLEPYVDEEFRGWIKPIEHIGLNGSINIGYRAEVIPTVCELYMKAHKDGKLTSRQLKMAEISSLIVQSLAKVGIIGLIDEATGYQQIRPRDALEAYFNKILTKELTAWCKRFPDEYYDNIYKLKGWPEFSTSKNKYSCVGHYTNDIIYSRLGEEVLDELKTRTPDTTKAKMHQWLTNDVGHPLLSNHMQTILTLQRLALSQGWGWNKFLSLVDSVAPKKNIL